MYLVNFIRGLFFPFIRYVLPLFSKKAKERVLFELKNTPIDRDFNADFSFEVSSEGELEQVQAYLDYLISNGRKIELLYFSPSVESKCEAMASSSIRVYRVPFLTYFWFNILGGQNIVSNLTAQKLILCRYDFFPELMIYGAKKSVSFILLSATLKNKERQKRMLKYYKLFDKIVVTTQKDREAFLNIGIAPRVLEVFEFRALQIDTRINAGTLNKLEFYPSLFAYLNSFSSDQRFLIGSAWPIEMGVFEDKKLISAIGSNEACLSIAPHKLNGTFIQKIKDHIPGHIPIYELDMDNYEEVFEQIKETPGVLIIKIARILCELYKYYGVAYVGGGHGRSIHSVLEPYFADARIFIGPKVHRSTEYDLVYENSKNFISILENPCDFYAVLQNNLITHSNTYDDKEIREMLIIKFKQEFEILCGKLDSC